uniref:HlyD family efflux transporter periplasmic adaptor subunit n=1 Tax=Eiseniibacteriota bacterium TaxID=2212470 RepID=A0A832I444_UNCEI
MSRRPALVVVPVLVVVAAAVTFLTVRRGGPDDALEATGTVEATEAALGFTVPGRLEAVRADEGDTVAAGQPLAWLERAETLARREQAAAQAAGARAALAELERGSRPEEIAAARAAAQAAADRLADAERDAARARALRERGVVSAQDLDKALTALEVARSARVQAAEQLRLVELGPRRERIESARAQLAAAEAAVRTLDATLAQMEVRAPFPGLVTVRHREPGEIVAAGSPVVTVLHRDDRWVRIYVPEHRIGAVRVGQRAAIANDTFRARRYAGRVVAIASQAEFTPKTVQTREERVRLVYAVKVRVTGDPAWDLKPGMPADVVLEGAGR